MLGSLTLHLLLALFSLTTPHPGKASPKNLVALRGGEGGRRLWTERFTSRELLPLNESTAVFICGTCGAHLALSSSVLSKDFQGQLGRAMRAPPPPSTGSRAPRLDRPTTAASASTVRPAGPYVCLRPPTPPAWV